jgi:predicted lipoprotein with Yx(FWY)xxD motif
MNRTRIPILAVVIAALVAVVVATSSGSTKKAQPKVPASSAVSLKQTAVGKSLVDANGRTLYLFQGDKPNVTRLSAAGRAVWPPFTANAKPRATGGAAAAGIGTIRGAGGGTQVTYNGHPLYYYIGDHKPGQALGQGLNQFGGLWYVLSGGGTAIVSAPTAAAPSRPAGNGSGYGY